MAIEHPISMRLGQTKTIGLKFTRKSDNQPLNLDTDLAVGDSSIELQVKVQEGNGDPALIALDLASGIVKRTQSGDDIGWADATVPSSATLASPWPTPPANIGTFRWDVKIVLASGAIDYPVEPSDWIVRPVVNGA